MAAVFAMSLSWTASAGDATSVVTEKVVAHHLKAFGDGDLEAILADYTEDSVLLTPNVR